MPESEPEKEHSWVTQMQPGPLQGHALFLPREGWGAGTRAIRHPNTEMSGPGVSVSTVPGGPKAPKYW